MDPKEIVRATVAELDAAGAVTVVALAHCVGQGIAVESLVHRDFNVWTPADCRLCRSGVPLEDPRD